jgi:hypothetical protein
LTRSTSGCHSEGDACSCAPSLTEILEPNASEKYSLSQKAAAGILRRATRRGRSLPPQLDEALKAVAGESWEPSPPPPTSSTPTKSSSDRDNS